MTLLETLHSLPVTDTINISLSNNPKLFVIFVIRSEDYWQAASHKDTDDVAILCMGWCESELAI